MTAPPSEAGASRRTWASAAATRKGHSSVQLVRWKRSSGKPDRTETDVDHEAWTDHLLREAAARGEFDNLPGTGQPIPDLDKPHDELWWVKQKLRRENVSFLPPSLQARKEIEDALVAASQARTEHEVRRIVGATNQRIRALLRIPPAGPPFNVMPYDVDRVLDDWRSARAAQTTEPTDDVEGGPAETEDKPSKRSRWRRRPASAPREHKPARS